MFLGVILGEMSNFVAQVALEVTGVDIKYLVECAGNVEAGAVALVEGLAGGQLLAGEPAAVGERILHLVTVFPDVFRRQGWPNFGNFYLGNTLQRIDNLLSLAFQLVTVRQMLPAAAATNSEMRATGLLAHVRGGDDALYPAHGKAFLLFFKLNVHNIAGSGKRHEHHHAVAASESVALGGNSCYFKPFYQGQRFSLS